MAVALDDLEKDGRTILNWLSKDLEEISSLIKINKDVQFLNLKEKRKEKNTQDFPKTLRAGVYLIRAKSKAGSFFTQPQPYKDLNNHS